MKTTPKTDAHIDILRKHGARITPVVKNAVDYLFETGSVHSPRQIKDALSHRLGSDIGYPTIYRVIDRLMEAGLISPMYNSSNKTGYFLCRNPDNHRHHHFICLKCHTVLEMALCPMGIFEKFAREQLKATITNHIMQISGICRICRGKRLTS